MPTNDTIWGRSIHPCSYPKVHGAPGLPKAASGLFYHSRHRAERGGYFLAQGAKAAGLMTQAGPAWVIANEQWVAGLVFTPEGSPLRALSPDELRAAAIALQRRFNNAADASPSAKDGLQGE